MRKYKGIIFVLVVLMNILLGLSSQEVQAGTRPISKTSAVIGCTYSDGVLFPGVRHNTYNPTYIPPGRVTPYPQMEFIGTIHYDGGTDLFFSLAQEDCSVGNSLSQPTKMIEFSIELIAGYKTFCDENYGYKSLDIRDYHGNKLEIECFTTVNSSAVKFIQCVMIRDGMVSSYFSYNNSIAYNTLLNYFRITFAEAFYLQFSLLFPTTN